MRDHLWLVGMAIILLSVFSGLFNYFKGRWQAIAGESISL